MLTHRTDSSKAQRCEFRAGPLHFQTAHLAPECKQSTFFHDGEPLVYKRLGQSAALYHADRYEALFGLKGGA